MPVTHTYETILHEVDFCVVGGGMAGLIAAVSAARRGAKTMILQDRPVFGGNASSEIRMWIGGARGKENKETGLLEEIMLTNLYRNPGLNYPLWDTVLYETARFQPNLEILLNCACTEVSTEGNQIVEVKGWQATTQQWHAVHATLYADCSGDSVLRICGADHRRGREARSEYNESLAPEQADSHTMGNSILLQPRETGRPHRAFTSPAWAHRFNENDLPNRPLTPLGDNFWWLETGGMGDTIAQAEVLRDELLKIGFGVWDLIKNHPDGRGQAWELDWIGALPGKRENVRYLGDHVLTQNDVLAEGRFDDLVAYGGWPMDDHPPLGLHFRGHPTVFHNTPSPYGIPYRSLYSRNIANLFFAGRNISASHMAMSSTRVMATCAICGQAVGTAAALAVRYNASPRDVGQHHLAELQQALMDDDAYLPWRKRAVADLSLSARLETEAGGAENLRSGIDRDLGDVNNGWWAAPGQTALYRFDANPRLREARFTFDSDLSRAKGMPHYYPLAGNLGEMPAVMARDFDLEALDSSGQWQIVQQVRDNARRLLRLPLAVETTAVRFRLLRAWGEDRAHVMAFEVR
jgi:hypothetical protein